MNIFLVFLGWGILALPPVHELGHVLLAKAQGLQVLEVRWFTLEDPLHYLGWTRIGPHTEAQDRAQRFYELAYVWFVMTVVLELVIWT